MKIFKFLLGLKKGNAQKRSYKKKDTSEEITPASSQSVDSSNAVGQAVRDF